MPSGVLTNHCRAQSAIVTLRLSSFARSRSGDKAGFRCVLNVELQRVVRFRRLLKMFELLTEIKSMAETAGWHQKDVRSQNDVICSKSAIIERGIGGCGRVNGGIDLKEVNLASPTQASQCQSIGPGHASEGIIDVGRRPIQADCQPGKPRCLSFRIASCVSKGVASESGKSVPAGCRIFDQLEDIRDASADLHRLRQRQETKCGHFVDKSFGFIGAELQGAAHGLRTSPAMDTSKSQA